MSTANNISEHMQVEDCEGAAVGTVDRVEEESIKLTKDTPYAGGEHRFIPLVWVSSADKVVRLNRPVAEVRRQWKENPVVVDEYPPEATQLPPNG